MIAFDPSLGIGMLLIAGVGSWYWLNRRIRHREKPIKIGSFVIYFLLLLFVQVLLLALFFYAALYVVLTP